MGNYVRVLVMLSVVIFAAGCTSGVAMRTYSEDRERVDQDIQGNSGYMMGAAGDSQAPVKKTRKMYVMEFSKSATEEDLNVTQPTKTSEETFYDSGDSRYETTSPSYASEMPIVETPSLVEYKVEKDDTLQKISKKFYNTYSKWPQIYAANKEVIKNPNRIKPGIKIQIP